MAYIDFINGLKELGFNVVELGEGRITFGYKIPVGKFLNQEITIGFVVPGDFPATPPGGLHVSPHLLPLNTSSKVHPSGGIHKNQKGFTNDFQYWSRPFPDWAKTDKSVKTYMAHIRHLFETQ